MSVDPSLVTSYRRPRTECGVFPDSIQNRHTSRKGQDSCTGVLLRQMVEPTSNRARLNARGSSRGTMASSGSIIPTSVWGRTLSVTIPHALDRTRYELGSSMMYGCPNARHITARAEYCPIPGSASQGLQILGYRAAVLLDQRAGCLLQHRPPVDATQWTEDFREFQVVGSHKRRHVGIALDESLVHVHDLRNTGSLEHEDRHENAVGIGRLSPWEGPPVVMKPVDQEIGQSGSAVLRGIDQPATGIISNTNTPVCQRRVDLARSILVRFCRADTTHHIALVRSQLDGRHLDHPKTARLGHRSRQQA